MLWYMALLHYDLCGKYCFPLWCHYPAGLGCDLKFENEVHWVFQISSWICQFRIRVSPRGSGVWIRICYMALEGAFNFSCSSFLSQIHYSLMISNDCPSLQKQWAAASPGVLSEFDVSFLETSVWVTLPEHVCLQPYFFGRQEGIASRMKNEH